MGVSQNNVLCPGCGPGNVFTGSASGYVSGGAGPVSRKSNIPALLKLKVATLKK